MEQDYKRYFQSYQAEKCNPNTNNWVEQLPWLDTKTRGPNYEWNMAFTKRNFTDLRKGFEVYTVLKNSLKNAN